LYDYTHLQFQKVLDSRLHFGPVFLGPQLTLHIRTKEGIMTGQPLTHPFVPYLGEPHKWGGSFAIAQLCGHPAMPTGEGDAESGRQALSQMDILQEEGLQKVAAKLFITRVSWEWKYGRLNEMDT
jgi:hypothetical protein